MDNILRRYKYNLKNLISSIGFYNDYINVLLRNHKNKKSYKNIEKICFFLGYPRSGSSILGAMLDAHKNVIMSHELNALKYIDAGFKKQVIYGLILRNSLMKSIIILAGNSLIVLKKQGGYLRYFPLIYSLPLRCLSSIWVFKS